MEAFSRLPQKFLVKFDGPIDYIPPNVKVLDWIPQQDVLGKKIFHCIVKYDILKQRLVPIVV
jgi:hypothetical protein